MTDTPTRPAPVRGWPTRDLAFDSKVEPCPTSGCWLWIGALGSCGYGSFWDGKRSVRPHRWAYERASGPIPEGLELDHLCRVRLCVNPDHLEPVTRKENTRRSMACVGINARKTHCIRGHPLSGDNLGRQKGGAARRCRQCERERNRRRDRNAEGRNPTEESEATK